MTKEICLKKRANICVFVIVFIAVFVLLVSFASAESIIWEVTPSDANSVYAAAYCNVDTGSLCPSEMGWQGKIIGYLFDIDLNQELSDTVELEFNVVDLGVEKVLLEIMAGTGQNYKVIEKEFKVDKKGKLVIPINSSVFQAGKTNFIKLDGKNIVGFGYGKNPPSFKIEHIALRNQEKKEFEPLGITELPDFDNIPVFNPIPPGIPRFPNFSYPVSNPIIPGPQVPNLSHGPQQPYNQSIDIQNITKISSTTETNSRQSQDNAVSSLSFTTNVLAPGISDEVLLDKTEAQAAKYFYEQSLSNGFVKDTNLAGHSSIAATGFGLTAFTIMAERYGSSSEWTYTPEQLRARTNKILDVLIEIQNKQAQNEALYGTHGLFYHFILADGTRSPNSEVSTIDSAILLVGVITAGEYFGGEVKQKAELILSNMDWEYFQKTPQNDFPSKDGNVNLYQFTHGWSPEGGRFLGTWDRPGDESILVSVIALASEPENDNFKKSLFSWPRVKRNYAGYGVVNSFFGSLFTYEFAHAWIDFQAIGKDKPGAGGVEAIDWWQNSVNASKAARQFVIDNSATYSSYGPDSWGLSAVYKPDGNYVGGYGALPTDSGTAFHDGTIAPYSSISTIPFFKDEDSGSLQSNLGFRALRHFYDNYYDNLWGNYGPKDSFNSQGQFSQIYTGIDQGPIVLMLENYRSELVWEQFLENERVKAALKGTFECPNGVCNPTNIPNCDENNDCNDNNSSTTDTCNNPGESYSLCLNVPIPPPEPMKLWEFSNFYNPFQVFGSRVCNVHGTSPCPKELGWQGNTIIFNFTLNSTSGLGDITKFNLGVGNVFTIENASISAGGSMQSLQLVKDNITVNAPGTYSTEIPLSLFSVGDNYIKLFVKNLEVGYGQPTQAFIISQVNLEASEGGIVPICDENIDCGQDGFIGEPFCSENDVAQNTTTPTCINPGTPDASCTNVISQQTLQQCQFLCSAGQCIRCSTNSQCNDNNPYTLDECISPGTPQSECENIPVNCIQDSDCGLTGFVNNSFCFQEDIYRNYETNVCSNPATINAECSKTVEQRLTEDCNDNNSSTQDSCVASVNGNASCSHVPIPSICGNQILESGEQCDDGNTNSGDGCSSSCQLEVGSCVIPYSGMQISESTTFCAGTYYLNDSIYITGNNLKLDCNNSGIYRQYHEPGLQLFSERGIQIIGKNNVAIEKCKVYYNFNDVYVENSTNIFLKGNSMSGRVSTYFYPVSSVIYSKNSSNLTITNNSLYAGDDASGVTFDKTVNSSIKKNTISGGDFLITLKDNSHYNVINDNFIGSNWDYGIKIENSRYNQIINNIIYYNLYQPGIWLSSASYNLIKSNNISKNGVIGPSGWSHRSGIFAYNSHSNQIIENSIYENEPYGIFFRESHNNIIFMNKINNNKIKGVYLISSNNNTLDNNTISSNNETAIYSDGSANIIKNNDIYNHSVGVSLYNNGNKIYNNFFLNKINAISTYQNSWNITKDCTKTNIIDGQCIGGNFWSDYSGFDLNEDGFGDTKIPHNASNNILIGGDYLPLTSVIPVFLTCGNNTIEPPEICDGNSQSCTINGYSGIQQCNSKCTGFLGCQPTEFCGDNIINGNEICDGNSQACSVNGYSGTKQCNSQCSSFGSCITTQVCGNGVKEGNEQCDDGNIDASDTYYTSNSSDNDGICVIDTTRSYQCKNNLCGDGYKNNVLEQCDDGNLANNDGCSSTCQIEIIVCDDNSDCNDGNQSTEDKCNNPGTVNSSCSHNLIRCFVNSDCGVNGFINSPFCTANNVTQDFKTFTCSNAGQATSFCSNSTAPKTKEICSDSCLNGQCVNIECFNNADCNDNRSNTEDICNNPGQTNSFCSNNNITCFTNSDCGINGYINQPFCVNKNVTQDFRIFTCNNGGTAQSSCSSSIEQRTKQTCAQQCSQGQCVFVECFTNAECNDLNPLTLDECINPGTPASDCRYTPITCASNTDCGINGYIGGNFCSNGNVARLYQNFTCNNGGTLQASCSSSASPVTQEVCVLGCSNEQCIQQQCGNGIREGTEVCDGNNQSCSINGYSGTQNCNAQCNGFGACTTIQFCGDGIRNGTEQCDDGNLVNNDGCSSTCQIEEPIEPMKLWEFSNFYNPFQVFGSRVCNVHGTSPCPKELGWQGNTLIFNFTLNSTSNLEEITKFNLGVGNVFTIENASISAGGSLQTLQLVKDNITVNAPGTYSTEIPLSLFSVGDNYIKLFVKNLEVGYGQPTQAFLISRVNLEASEGGIVPVCDENIDCGQDGFIGEPFCSANNVKRNFISYLCNNRGTTQAFCSNQTVQQTIEQCQYGCSNSNGQCNPPPCTNECTNAGDKRCTGNNLQTCGNYDSDSCLEWGGDVSCPNGCSNNQCVEGDGVIWEFSNFTHISPLKKYKSYTCDVAGTKPCQREIGWAGDKLKFKFKLSGEEDLGEIVQFNFSVNAIKPASRYKYVSIYAGKSKKLIQENILIDHTGMYSVEIPAAVFKKGTNYVRIYGEDIEVGYGEPWWLVFDYVSLEETNKEYEEPNLAECPKAVNDDAFNFIWQLNDYTDSKVYLELAYDKNGVNKIFKKINVPDSQAVVFLASDYRSKMFSYQKKSSSELIYARIKAIHDTKGTVYSNACEIGVIPVIDVPPSSRAPMGIVEWEEDEGLDVEEHENYLEQEEDE